jgi:flagellar biosynthesis/type III secretory pathway chaperone
MEHLSHKIEETYREEATLLQELLNSLGSERENLIDLNIKNLWAIMEEKQKILTSLGDMERRVRALMEESPLEPGALPKDRLPIAAHCRKVASLKEEIKARAKENVAFIQESLQFLDEIISIFATGGRAEYSYDPMLRRQKASPSFMYQSEV